MSGYWTTVEPGAGSGAALGMQGIVGFISATAIVFDRGSIVGQKVAIDVVVRASRMVLGAYLVEMSPRRPGEPWTRAVRDLLRLAEAGRLRGVVVDRIDRFAAGRDDALLIAVALVERGVKLIEAGDGASATGRRDARRCPRRRVASRNLAETAF